MLSWLTRLARPLVGSCLVIALFLAGVTAVSAQSTMDPSLDSDGDGTMNNMDPDDDNDGYADDIDCAPFDVLRWDNCDDAPSVGDGEPDNDGDGIADRVDPDDDNDGIVDEQDSHPFDPTRGQKPPPSIIDSDADSDGDGIANSHDPDDDNDGVVDELDCAPFDPSVSVCPTTVPDPGPTGDEGVSRPGGGQEYVAASGGPRGPVVTSLPATGVGGPAPLSSMATGAGIAVMLLGVAGLRGWLHPVRVPARRH